MHRSAVLASLSALALLASAIVPPASAQPPVPGGGPGKPAPGPGPGPGPAEDQGLAPDQGPDQAQDRAGGQVPRRSPLRALASPRRRAQEPRGEYEFEAPPGDNFNRVYRVNRTTGQVTACQYQQGPGVGVTLCFNSGEGAGPQAQGDYGLVASRLKEEGGIFRFNRRTGEMSICFVLNNLAVCTPPGR